MATAVNECEFWLPPKFFTDNEYAIDRNYKKRGFTGIETNYRKQSPYKSGSFRFPSDLISTDTTENDEDDYLSGLTRKMAYTSIEDDYLQQCSARQGLLKSMFNPQPVNRDLLYAAAKEIALMKINKEFHGFGNDRELLPFINANIEAASGYNNRQRILSLQKLQFMQLRQLQIMKKQQSSAFCGNISATRPLSLSHLPNTQQNQRKCLAGSDNALMGVKTTVARRQSAGTGVFLPRQPLTRSDSAKKQDPAWLRNPNKPRSMPSQRKPKARSLSNPAECVLPQEWSY